MPLINYMTGVADLSLGDNSATDAPDLNATTFTFAEADYDDIETGSINAGLDTSKTYHLAVAAVGRQKTLGGLTIGRATTVSGDLTPTAGQGLLVTLANGSFPAGFANSAGLIIYLNVGSSDYQPVAFAPIDPLEDFNYMLTFEPPKQAPFFTDTVLGAATAHKLLGDRDPGGWDYTDYEVSSGGKALRHFAETFQLNPDNSPAFSMATGRGTGVEFNVISYSEKGLVKYNSGNYVKYTTGGKVIEQFNMDIQTSQGKLPPIKPMKVYLPPDANGAVQVRTLIGTTTQNQVETTEQFRKDGAVELAINFQPAAQDYLTLFMHTTFAHKIL